MFHSLKNAKEELTGLLPGFLSDSISEYRVSARKRSTLSGDYLEQLRSSINVAEVENLISYETAIRLRIRYGLASGE